jgi:hypothetical protein
VVGPDVDHLESYLRCTSELCSTPAKKRAWSFAGGVANWGPAASAKSALSVALPTKSRAKKTWGFMAEAVLKH